MCEIEARKMCQVKNIVSGVAKLAKKYQFNFKVTACYYGQYIMSHEISFHGNMFKGRDIWITENSYDLPQENNKYLILCGEGGEELSPRMNETEALEFLDKFIGELKNI